MQYFFSVYFILKFCEKNIKRVAAAFKILFFKNERTVSRRFVGLFPRSMTENFYVRVRKRVLFPAIIVQYLYNGISLAFFAERAIIETEEEMTAARELERGEY